MADPTQAPDPATSERGPEGPRRRRLPTPAQAGVYILPVMLVGLTLGFAHFLDRHYPIREWLFWRYASYWFACALWSVSCLSLGDFLVKRLLPCPAPFREHLGTSFALGVFAYTFLMSLAGFAHLYRPGLFFAMPALMLAIGGPGLMGTSTRFWRHLKAARAKAKPPPAWSWFVLAFGLVGLGMVYFLVLTPDNVQFDSRWKHFALAEEYAVTGGVRRFAEGWTVETNPHLATYVYLWGFLLPSGNAFDRIELAAHIEFTIFVATTLMIPALVRRLVPGATARHAWAARFLFPGVFLYDSSVSGGADHVGALFTIPLFLLLLRASKDLSPRACIAMALAAAGGIMTKLTGLLMLLPLPAAWLLVRAVVIARRKDLGPARHYAWQGPLAALGVGLAVTSTFWLKNWIYYGDPIYPSLHEYLHLRPWTVDAADLFEHGYKDFQFWRPPHNMKGLADTLRALVEFSFFPNDYPKFHGKVPVFGSLFTLLLICLPFLKRTRRIWALVAAVHLGIFVWFWTHHQDRYLQTLVPWMAAVTASVIILISRVSIYTRAPLGALIGLQIVWGGDVYFIPTHGMIRSPIKAVLDLLAGGYEKNYRGRLHQPTFGAVGEALPKDARVLLHDNHVHLGVHAATVNDWGGWQFGISYGRQKTPGEVYDLLAGMGVTHLLWTRGQSRGWDSIAGDLAFYHFATRETTDRNKIGPNMLARMPDARPTGTFDDPVLFLGCNDDGYRSGLYPLSEMTVPVFGPRSRRFPAPRVRAKGDDQDAADLALQAGFMVLNPKCHPDPPAGANEHFERVANRKLVRDPTDKLYWTLWVRSTEAPQPDAPGSQPPVEDTPPAF
jgi:hypothetical protein